MNIPLSRPFLLVLLLGLLLGKKLGFVESKCDPPCSYPDPADRYVGKDMRMYNGGTGHKVVDCTENEPFKELAIEEWDGNVDVVNCQMEFLKVERVTGNVTVTGATAEYVSIREIHGNLIFCTAYVGDKVSIQDIYGDTNLDCVMGRGELNVVPQSDGQVSLSGSDFGAVSVREAGTVKIGEDNTISDLLSLEKTRALLLIGNTLTDVECKEIGVLKFSGNTVAGDTKGECSTLTRTDLSQLATAKCENDCFFPEPMSVTADTQKKLERTDGEGDVEFDCRDMDPVKEIRVSNWDGNVYIWNCYVEVLHLSEISGHVTITNTAVDADMTIDTIIGDIHVCSASVAGTMKVNRVVGNVMLKCIMGLNDLCVDDSGDVKLLTSNFAGGDKVQIKRSSDVEVEGNILKNIIIEESKSLHITNNEIATVTCGGIQNPVKSSDNKVDGYPDGQGEVTCRDKVIPLSDSTSEQPPANGSLDPMSSTREWKDGDFTLVIDGTHEKPTKEVRIENWSNNVSILNWHVKGELHVEGVSGYMTITNTTVDGKLNLKKTSGGVSLCSVRVGDDTKIFRSGPVDLNCIEEGGKLTMEYVTGDVVVNGSKFWRDEADVRILKGSGNVIVQGSEIYELVVEKKGDVAIIENNLTHVLCEENDSVRGCGNRISGRSYHEYHIKHKCTAAA